MKAPRPLLPIASLSCLVLPPAAGATTVVLDTFTDGARTNGSDALDINWYNIRTNVALSVASDAVINKGNALQVNNSTTFNRFAGVFNTPITLLSGQTLELSFTYRFVDSPTSLGDGFRVGLYNNGGTPFIADNSDSSALEADDSGYGLGINPGLDSATGISIRQEAAGNSILGGASPGNFGSVAGASSGASVNSGNTASHSAFFSITRNPDGSLSMLGSIDGGTAATATTGTTPLTYTFHHIALGQGNLNLDYAIDDFRIDVIPEPSSGLLVMGGALLVASRRRR